MKQLMNFHSRFSLKTRIQILISVLLVVLVGMPLFYLVHELDKVQEQASINLVEHTSQSVYRSLVEAFMSNSPAEVQTQVMKMGRNPDVDGIRIFRTNGDIVYSTNVNEKNKNLLEIENDIDGLELIEAFKKVDGVLIHDHLILAQKECKSCHISDEELLAIMQVKVHLPEAAQIIPTIKNWLIFGTLFIVFLLWMSLNFIYERQVENKLATILDGFSRLAHGDLKTKVDLPGRDEFAKLANRFNYTVSQLRKARQNEEKYMRESLTQTDRIVSFGQVAAEIAHEVNNPAGILLTRAEVLKEELEENPANRQYIDDLQVIINQTEKIADTTKNILHNVRLMPADFEKMDIKKIILDCLYDLNPIIKDKNIKLDFKCPVEAACVLGNKEQLKQAFRHLISNSIDASAYDGSRIEIHLNSLYNNQEKEIFQIKFKDQGPGISPDLENEIFKPFFSTKDNFHHSGLGLFMAKIIIVNHRGKLYLDKSESGATFVAELEAYYGHN